MNATLIFLKIAFKSLQFLLYLGCSIIASQFCSQSSYTVRQ